MRKQCCVVEADLKRKHKRMRENAFVFLRSTFFRWASIIEAICPDLKAAPRVLSIGDTHLENFGTWRDVEGRLVWGVNDFDEAAVTPYPFDLVRLATSARLAPGIPLRNREVASAILEGYASGLATPRPILLDEQETWMRPYVACSDDDRSNFWKEVKGYPTADPPRVVGDGLVQSLPGGASILRFASRSKGGGSLGRPRYVAIAAWRGGRIVREAKALVPSAWNWAHADALPECRFLDLVNGRYRSPDPFLAVHDGFVFRRIAAELKEGRIRGRGRAQGKIRPAKGDGLRCWCNPRRQPRATRRIARGSRKTSTGLALRGSPHSGEGSRGRFPGLVERRQLMCTSAWRHKGDVRSIPNFP